MLKSYGLLQSFLYNLLSCSLFFFFFFADLCWAVCINRSVESAFNLLDDGREPVRLSAQHLVNGVHKHESGYITHFDGVRDFMQRHGMVPEASCPWTGEVDKELGCTHDHVQGESAYKVDDLVYLDKIVERDLILVLQKQPILAVMEYCDELEDHREVNLLYTLYLILCFIFKKK